MKKLERIKLKQLSHEMNILDRAESAKIVGDSYTRSYGYTWFTASEQDSMIAEGNWTGGLVQDLGYVGSDFTVQASDTGFSDSNYSGSGYTESELDAMVDSGTWNGGYVQNLGYVGSSFAIEGSDNIVGGYDITGSDLINGMSNEGLDQVAAILLGLIPGWGDYTAFVADEFNEMAGDFVQAAWDNGIASTDTLHVTKVRTDSNETTYYLYDSDNSLISSGVFDNSGWSKNE